MDALKAAGGDGWEEKYKSVKAEFDKFKAETEASNLKAKTAEAFKAVLRESGIADKYISVVQKATDLSSYKLNEDGKLEDVDKIKAAIKQEWPEFLAKTEEHGAEEKDPPEEQGGDGKSEAAERARELARQYHDRQYGKGGNES